MLNFLPFSQVSSRMSPRRTRLQLPQFLACLQHTCRALGAGPRRGRPVELGNKGGASLPAPDFQEIGILGIFIFNCLAELSSTSLAQMLRPTVARSLPQQKSFEG